MIDVTDALNWPALALGGVVVFAGSVVQATTGLGLGMIAAPILLLIDPAFVPATLLLLALYVSMLIAVRELASIDLKGLLAALGGRLPGSILAGLTMTAVALPVYNLLFGVLVLCAVVLSASGWRVSSTAPTLFVAGFASGYMGTLTSIGAPPMAIAYQNDSPAVIRSTMAVYFVVGSSISLAILAYYDAFSLAQFAASFFFLPPLIAGFVVSGYLVNRMNTQGARLAVLWLSGSSAGVLLAKALIEL